jgi:hypothetical protein
MQRPVSHCRDARHSSPISSLSALLQADPAHRAAAMMTLNRMLHDSLYITEPAAQAAFLRRRDARG